MFSDREARDGMADMYQVGFNIRRAILTGRGGAEAYKDMLACNKILRGRDKKTSHDNNVWLRGEISKAIAKGRESSLMYDLYRQALLMDAPDYFDEYMLYLELDREAKERFYQPRRRVLKQIVDKIQLLADDKLDELFISQPPRTGKTTLLMMLMTWIMGRNSESSNLYSAFSDVITRAFYNGVLEVMQDASTYKWGDVFPGSQIVATNSADETINVDRKKRYPSFTSRSLYGTLNGACDCNGYLVSDDLIGGIEEALSKDRMVSAWSKVDNNLLPRAKQKAKVLWCGTRWSVVDPIGVRLELLQNDKAFAKRRYAEINVPAMNERDESNFVYEHGVGFDTNYYVMRRASFERNNDMASWNAQYMGDPIEREGTLFTPDGFRYYNGVLPSDEPDRVFMAVDSSFGGGDYVAAPVCFQYGNDIYVHDVVFDNGDKRVTQPLIAAKCAQHGVSICQIEANKSTESYVEGVRAEIEKRGYKCTVVSKPAPNDKSKEQRIFDNAPDVREMMIFVENGKRSKEYSLFMQNVFGYKIIGKNKHDDAPDSLTIAISMVKVRERKVEIFRRFF